MKKRLIADNKLELVNTQGQPINTYGLPKPEDIISMEFDEWLKLPEVAEKIKKRYLTKEEALEIWREGNEKAYEWAIKHNNIYWNTHQNTFNNTLNLNPEDEEQKQLLEEYEKQKQKALEIQLNELKKRDMYKEETPNKKEKWYDPANLVAIIEKNKPNTINFKRHLDVDTRDKPFVWVEGTQIEDTDCFASSLGTIVVGMKGDSHMSTISRKILRDTSAFAPPQKTDEKYNQDGKFNAKLFAKDYINFQSKNKWYRNGISDYKDLEDNVIFGHIYGDIAILDGTSWQGKNANMDNAISALKSCGKFSQIWEISHNSNLGQTIERKAKHKGLKLKNCYARLVYCAPQSLGFTADMQRQIDTLLHSEELANFIYDDFMKNNEAIVELNDLLKKHCIISAENLADIITEVVNNSYVAQARHMSDKALGDKKNSGNRSNRLLRAVNDMQTRIINHCMNIIKEKSSNFEKHLNDIIDNYFSDKDNIERIYNDLATNNNTLKTILEDTNVTPQGKNVLKTIIKRNLTLAKAQSQLLRNEIIKNANINNFANQWASLINVNINNSEEMKEAIEKKIAETPNWSNDNDVELVKFIQKGLFKLFIHKNNDYRKLLFRRFKVPTINPDTGDYNFI